MRSRPDLSRLSAELQVEFTRHACDTIGECVGALAMTGSNRGDEVFGRARFRAVSGRTGNDQAAAILSAVRRAATPGATVLIIEAVADEEVLDRHSSVTPNGASVKNHLTNAQHEVLESASGPRLAATRGATAGVPQ